MIGAVIFDLDGLLIDSEPWWQRAQKEVFTSLGVPLTQEHARAMTGLRVADHVDHWYSLYPWPSPSKADVVAMIEDRALELIGAFGAPLPGAAQAVGALAERGVPLGVASSSATTLIQAALEQLELRQYFDVIQSAEHEPAGKPHPGVYLSAARALGINPLFCIAFEDSVHGVFAAKAAGMACIAVPTARDRHDDRYRIADEIIDSLAELDVDALVDVPMASSQRRGQAARHQIALPYGRRDRRREHTTKAAFSSP